MNVKSAKIVLLAGLPRTGSTLLQNLLVQNPDVYSEGNSGLCQIMWDAECSCEHSAIQQLKGVNKDISFKHAYIKSIPNIYYPDLNKEIIVDKCRTWVNNSNISIARKYIDKDIKSIVMIRPLEEIIASFMRVSNKNGMNLTYENLLSEENKLSNEVLATCLAAKSKDSSFLFVSYHDLVSRTQETMARIYNHIGEKPYTHNVHEVEQTVFEDDEQNHMIGMHDIRPQVAKQANEIVLPDWVKAACEDMTNKLYGELSWINEQ